MTESLNADQLLINKLTEIILANLENEKFGVQELIRESGMSRYVLIRRLNAATGKNINQFINVIRLKKALEMLENEEYTVSEVAYKTGFGSPAYFNRSFHNYFGFPPGNVRKGNSNHLKQNDQNQVNTTVLKKEGNRLNVPVSFIRLMILIPVLVFAGYFAIRKIHKSEWTDDLISRNDRLSIAVMPFQNNTKDTLWNSWQGGIQEYLISFLSNSKDLKIIEEETVNNLLQNKGLTEFASVSSGIAGELSKSLKTNLFIYGSIKQAGNTIRFDAQLIRTKSKEVIKSFVIEGPFREENIFQIIDTLSKDINDFLVLSKLIRKDPLYRNIEYSTKSPEAFRYYDFGSHAFAKGDWLTAIKWLLKAYAADSNFYDPYVGLSSAYSGQGMMEENLKWVVKAYEKKDMWPVEEQLFASWAYASNFEPEKVIPYLRELQELNKESSYNYLIGMAYHGMHQYEKAITEFELYLKKSRQYGKQNLKNNFAYFWLGQVYHRTGQYKKEKKLYRSAERFNNDQESMVYRQIVYRKAILAFAVGDTSSGNQYVQKLMALMNLVLSSQSDIALSLAGLYAEASMLEKAEDFYQKALLIEPENTNTMDSYARFLTDNNQNLDKVTELMDKAMILAKNKLDYYSYLNTKGWGYYKQKKYRESLEAIQTAWDSVPYPLFEIRDHLAEVKKTVQDQRLDPLVLK